MKTIKCSPPQDKLPLKRYPNTTPLFFTGMAKGLRLVSEAIKLSYQQVNLILDSCKAVGVFSCHIS